MLKKIKDFIDQGDRFIITTHIDPDGDAVGSAFSLYWGLTSLKKKVHIYMRDTIPYRYQFLPGPSSIMHVYPTERYDGVLVLDCGDFFRVGDDHERLKDAGTIINIDHHDTNGLYGEINLVDAGVSSTAEIIYLLLKELGVVISYNMAINIYTAILTDTGSFRYENAGSKAFLICEEMIRLGVKPSYVSQMVYETHPKERFKLFGQVYSTMEICAEDRVVLAWVTQKMLETTGTSREHTDGLVESIREMRDIEAAVLLRELNGNRYKASMRSKGDIDVARICNVFGGGGHKNAAGCIVDGAMEEVKDKIKEAFKICEGG